MTMFVSSMLNGGFLGVQQLQGLDCSSIKPIHDLSSDRREISHPMCIQNGLNPLPFNPLPEDHA